MAIKRDFSIQLPIIGGPALSIGGGGGTTYSNDGKYVGKGGRVAGSSGTDMFGNTVITTQYNTNNSVTNATADAYGALIFSAGSLGTNLTANRQGVVLANGGTVNTATANNSAALLAFGGGTINQYNVNSGGALFVGDQSSNKEVATRLSNKGITDYSGTGIAKAGTIQFGATETLTSGGTDLNSVIQGTQNVSAGGIAIGDTVNSGGVQNIFKNGVAQKSVVDKNGQMVVSSGGYADLPTVQSGGQISVAPNGNLRGAIVRNGGAVTVTSGGAAKDVVVSSGGTETVQSGGTITGGAISSGGTEVVSSGGTAYNVTVSSGGSLVVAAGANMQGTVVSSGAVIDVDTLPYISGGTVSLNGNTLTVTEGGSTWSTVLGGSYNKSDYFTISRDSDGSTKLTFVCFCAGTKIRVPGGEKTVEELEIGDRVLTHVDGQAVEQTLTWVGKRSMKVRSDLPVDEAGYPVRIVKDAIAPNVPAEDLLVTAEHCLFFDGRFIPARMLVNGRSVFYDLTMSEYDYFHVETEEHSVLWSNGALSESYLDTGNRRDFGQQGRIVRFVNSPDRNWNEHGAAPLAVTRDLVEPVYRALEDRAVSMDLQDQRPALQTTEDANLHLLTQDGQRLDVARRTDSGQHVFMLPAGVNNVRIVSRASRPLDVHGSLVDDRRSLGALIGDIKLWTEDGMQTLSAHLTDETLDGWYAPEADNTRWTRGYAALNLPQRSDLSLSVISLEIKAAGPYIVDENEVSSSLVNAS